MGFLDERLTFFEWLRVVLGWLILGPLVIGFIGSAIFVLLAGIYLTIGPIFGFAQ